jgi:hypothetical protein
VMLMLSYAPSAVSRHPYHCNLFAKITTKFLLQGAQPRRPPAQFFVMGADMSMDTEDPSLNTDEPFFQPYCAACSAVWRSPPDPSSTPCPFSHAKLRAARLQVLISMYFGGGETSSKMPDLLSFTRKSIVLTIRRRYYSRCF